MSASSRAEEVQEYRQAPRLLGGLVPATVAYAATGLETRIHRGLPSPYGPIRGHRIHGRPIAARGSERAALRSVFGGELGMSPKQVSRLMSFDRAKRLITDAVGVGARLDLTSIALRIGFYDHAHLDRDFAALTGTSPTRWLAEERGNIQAGGHRTSA